MEQDLGNFFDPEYIKNATKKLIHVHFLYSYVQGDNLISTIENWEKVIINETTTLKLSPVGGFYLEKFICEFEYQYQMAISSFMCVKFADELGNCYKSEKEQTVLYFLKSMFEIIKDNIIEYSPDEIIPLQKLFYYIDDNLGSRPFRRMVERFIAVMKNKVQRAEQVDSNSVKKLTKILQDAETLQKEAESYFLDKLGNQQQKRRG
jgi:hypothetical protein